MTQEVAQFGEKDTAREQPGGVARENVQELDLKRAVRLGALGGLTIIFLAAVGMIEAFADRFLIQPYLTLSYTALLLVPLLFGYLAAKLPDPVEGVKQASPGPRNVLAGLIAGVLTGVGAALIVLITDSFDVRDVFIALSPRLVIIMTLGLDLLPGLAALVAGGTILGTIGGSLWLIVKKWRGPLMNAFIWTLLVGLLQQAVQQILRGLMLDPVAQFLYSPLGGLTPVGAGLIFLLVLGIYIYMDRRETSLRERYDALPDQSKQRVLIAGTVAGLIGIFVLPQILGVFLSEVLDLVGIFLLMGLGLNLVVGFAGLLDLGYVAFFAVGAYTTAILTSPSSPAFAPEITFWAALPFVVGAAALAGIVVGTPVLRMRGDYLAIVTLGFGEIARILFISEALFPYVGGAQGITQIPTISVAGFTASSPPEFFYPIAALVLLAIYATWALENSRIGRMWKAMREDEPVAEVMGINTVQAKLTAFVMGAIIASFGGALFAAKIGSVFPHSFNIVVSIQVLVLIIVGGMGSIPGVIVGAIVIIGLPEMLREFAEFKFLMYGALLIYMMLNKPEGFIPSRERMRELHQDEMMQDAWLVDEQANKEADAAAAGAAGGQD